MASSRQPVFAFIETKLRQCTGARNVSETPSPRQGTGATGSAATPTAPTAVAGQIPTPPVGRRHRRIQALQNPAFPSAAHAPHPPAAWRTRRTFRPTTDDNSIKRAARRVVRSTDPARAPSGAPAGGTALPTKAPPPSDSAQLPASVLPRRLPPVPGPPSAAASHKHGAKARRAAAATAATVTGGAGRTTIGEQHCHEKGPQPSGAAPSKRPSDVPPPPKLPFTAGVGASASTYDLAPFTPFPALAGSIQGDAVFLEEATAISYCPGLPWDTLLVPVASSETRASAGQPPAQASMQHQVLVLPVVRMTVPPGANELYHMYIYPLLPAKQCNWIIAEAEAHARAAGWTKGRHKSYPTVDIPVSLIPSVFAFVNTMLYNKMYPFMATHFGFRPTDFWIQDMFIVKYDVSDPTGQTMLAMHRDGSLLSFILLLNPATDFDGGHTHFELLRRTATLEQGQALIMCGKLRHAGLPITRGTRYILVGFINATSPRLNPQLVNREHPYWHTTSLKVSDLWLLKNALK